MKKLVLEKVGNIVKNKEKVKEVLGVDISHRGKELYIEGEPLEEYEAETVIRALDLGFTPEVALLIKERELALDILSIKDFTKRKDMASIKARIIGTKGKTLKTLTELTDCFFAVSNNEVGIIGHPEQMKLAQEAVASLIRGSKQANVYKFLEKHHIQPVVDLGLKEPKKKSEE
jgi:KH domain-containing protein